MQLSSQGLALIRRHEGLRLDAYLDPVGIPTIGYGSTLNVSMGQSITEQEALELLLADVERFEDAVRESVNVPINQHQFDALVSLCFNIGEGAFKRSTLLRKLNAGDHAGAADEFLRWKHAGGRVLPGLVTRRDDERRLFLMPPAPEEWIEEVDAQARTAYANSDT